MRPWLEKHTQTLLEIHKSVTQSIEQQQSAIWAVQVAVGISMLRGGHETEVMRLLGSVLVGCGLPSREASWRAIIDGGRHSTAHKLYIFPYIPVKPCCDLTFDNSTDPFWWSVGEAQSGHANNNQDGR